MTSQELYVHWDDFVRLWWEVGHRYAYKLGAWKGF